jgi:cold shock CspA family protein/ribosome-associated translation inhibitor RaiA
MNVKIEGQHTQVEADVQLMVTERLEALNAPYDDILHARVAFIKHERHNKGSDEVRMFLTLSGKSFSIKRQADTLDEALNDALDVVTRQVREFRQIRQHAAKVPTPHPRGRIIRLFPEEGYGFIETESHQEVYFHENAVHHIAFEDLEVGMTVELSVEAGHQGPQASRVTLYKS